MLWTNRTDIGTSAVIDRAVLLAQSHGVEHASAFLARHGVAPTAITRILSSRRRPLVTTHRLAPPAPNRNASG